MVNHILISPWSNQKIYRKGIRQLFVINAFEQSIFLTSLRPIKIK